MGDDRFFRYNEYTDCIEADTVLDAAFRTVEDIRRVIPYADERFWVITGSGVWKLRYDGRRSAELTPCAGIPGRQHDLRVRTGGAARRFDLSFLRGQRLRTRLIAGRRNPPPSDSSATRIAACVGAPGR